MSILKAFFTDKPRLAGDTKGPRQACELIIFFADVSGSTRMHETLGDRIAHECITQSLDSMSDYVGNHKGQVIQTIGDEIMACFETALDAVSCACDIQRHFNYSTTSHGHRVKVHIGFCKGPVQLDRGKPFGDTVNVAARLTSLARGGQIISTSGTIEDLPREKKGLCRPLVRIKVKGKSEPLDTVDVVWNLEDATSIFVPGQTEEASGESVRVMLSFQGSQVLVNGENTPFTLGRGKDSDLKVSSETASRSHARIEYLHNELVFADHSTNGTYINTAQGRHAWGGMDIHLHRRTWTLVGDGVISLGRPVSPEDSQGIAFSVKSGG